MPVFACGSINSSFPLSCISLHRSVVTFIQYGIMKAFLEIHFAVIKGADSINYLNQCVI